MAKTNAQRQADYRQRRLSTDGTGERLNTIIDVHPKRALERLATCYGVTQCAILEHLLIDFERTTIDRLTPDQRADYYVGKVRLDLNVTR